MTTATQSLAHKTLIIVGTVLAMLALVALVLYASDVVLLAFAGILLGVLLDGLASTLAAKSPLSRFWALLVVIAAFAVLLVGAGFIVGPQIAAQTGEMRTALTEGLEALRARLEQLAWAQPLLSELPGNGSLGALSSGALGRLTGTLSTVFGLISNVFIIAFVGIYLAVHPNLYLDNVVRLFGRSRHAHMREVLATLGHALRRWLLGQFLSMSIVGLLTTIGLLILGVPLALTLGLIAFLLAFIPYLGPIAATVPAVLVAFIEGPTMVLYVLGLYGGVQFIESYLATPMIQKQVVSLPPALLIFAQILMGALTGVIGIALATPLAVVVIVLVQMLYVEDVLGDDVTPLGEKEEENTDEDDSGG